MSDGPFTHRQRFHIDGKLHRLTKPNTIEKLRKLLDNMEAHWLQAGLHPLTQPGEFDMNNAHSVTRVSPDELIIVSTSGKILRLQNVETSRRDR